MLGIRMVIGLSSSDRFVAVSIAQLRDAAEELSIKISKAEGTPGSIVGICRGGLVLSRLLSDFLNVKNIEMVKAARYLDVSKPKSKTQIGKLPLDLGKGRGYILLVDDVSDRGDTLAAVYNVVENYLKKNNINKRIVTCTYAIKTGTSFEPDFYAVTVDKGKWIIYEYEVNEMLMSFKKNKDREGLRFLKKNFR